MNNMERDVHFYSTPGSPKWKLMIDENTHYMGIGNPLQDEVYSSMLNKKLVPSEAEALEEAMRRPQFNTVDKPIMMYIDAGPMGDVIIPLKPGYVEQQEAVGAVLQFLFENATTRAKINNQK